MFAVTHTARFAGAGLLLLAMSSPASAHVTLENQSAAPNSTYKAVLRVGHGCDGKPTTAIRVRIPEGVIVAKPQPKAGWEVAVTKAAYARTYDYYGTPLSEGVTEIAWTGGELDDGYYDEFIFRARLTGFTPDTMIYFPVVQECAGGVHRWIEIPAAGKKADDYEEPAPGLKIVAPSS